MVLSSPDTLSASLADDKSVIQRVLELARRHLRMDVSYIAEFRDDKQLYQSLSGDSRSFNMVVDDGLELAGTYCAKMTDGMLPNVIPNTAVDSRVRDLPVTAQNQIGSYVGVPLTLSNGRLYGTFCCLSHAPEPDLSERDATFMRMLADLLVEQIDREYERAQARAEIHKVLRTGRLDMALQPVVQVSNRKQIGAEALSRFPGANGSPLQLFTEAQSVGLGVELERLAASRALALLSTRPQSEFLAINLSPQTLMDAVADLAALPPAIATRVVVEITEHFAIHRYDELRRATKDMRHAGIRLAIDDAGAGYASLHHVVQLEPDIIKIDRALVDGASTDHVKRSVIRGFVTLARELSAQVVGEGVERETDFQALHDLDVDAAQGYLLGRPTITHAGSRGASPFPEQRSR